MNPVGLAQARANQQTAIYEAVFAKRHDVPRTTLTSGKVLSRAIDKSREWTTPRGGRTIPPNSSQSKDSRWHGMLECHIGRGGWNGSADTSALLNENLYRLRFDKSNNHGPTRQRTEPVSGVMLPGAVSLRDFGRAKAMWTFRLRRSIEVVDLHASDEKVQRFLASVAESSSVRNAQRDLKRIDPGAAEHLDLIGMMMLADSWAYPATRAVGVAALSMGHSEGLAADTVRHELASTKTSKGNVVLSGEDGQELHDLEPEFEIRRLQGFGQDGREVLTVRELEINELASSVTPDTEIEL